MKYSITLLAVALSCLGSLTLAHAEDYPLKKCVVTGDALGGDLGEPIDIHYQGRLVRLCCKSCVKKFNKSPEKYLKELDAAAKAH
jgi:hypothetical protein